MKGIFPMPPGRGGATARAVSTGVVVHIPDMSTDPESRATAALVQAGFRTSLSVPMLRDGQPIGAITVARREARPFSDRADRLAPDLRRPGGHRDRERAPVHGARRAEPRADRVARAADGDRRDPASHLRLADRHPADLRDHRPVRDHPVRGRSVRRPHVRRGAHPHRSALWPDARRDQGHRTGLSSATEPPQRNGPRDSHGRGRPDSRSQRGSRSGRFRSGATGPFSPSR